MSEQAARPGGGIHRDEPRRILIAACASVGVLALPQYIMAIRRLPEHMRLRVVLSDAADHMLPLRSVAPFCDEAYKPGKFWSKTGVGFIELAEWPDLFAVLPSSCDILARVAAGLTDKPIAMLAVAHPGSVVFFPNMNRYMWERPSTARAVQTLRDDGHVVIEPLRQEAFAAAAGRFEPGYVLPEPKAAAQCLLAELDKRRPS